MDFHLRVRHWVVDWFIIGVVCGAVALVNILFHRAAPDDVALSLFFGALYWIIGGVVCYCVEGVQVEAQHHAEHGATILSAKDQREYHCASDFLLPGLHRR